MSLKKEYFFEEGCYILELLNSPDEPAVSVARARVPAGATTRWHVLEGITERYIILEGQGRAEVDGTAGRDVGPGDVVTIPPGSAQRIHNSGTDDLVFLAVCTPRFVAEYYRDVDSRQD